MMFVMILLLQHFSSVACLLTYYSK